MRYKELAEARPWKQYLGRSRRCLATNGETTVEVKGSCGTVLTGRTESFHGYFVRIVGPDTYEWLGTHPQSLKQALANAATAAERSGWKLLAVGLLDEWKVSGLSWNSGWGYHPAFADKVHMLDTLMNATDDK